MASRKTQRHADRGTRRVQADKVLTNAAQQLAGIADALDVAGVTVDQRRQLASVLMRIRDEQDQRGQPDEFRRRVLKEVEHRVVTNCLWSPVDGTPRQRNYEALRAEMARNAAIARALQAVLDAEIAVEREERPDDGGNVTVFKRRPDLEEAFFAAHDRFNAAVPLCQ